MRTRAAVLSAPNEPLTIDHVEVSDPKQGEVLVRMVASGLCHTDLSAMTGKLPVPVPIILGHEGAGIVEALGAGMTKLAKGDHVVTAVISGLVQVGSEVALDGLGLILKNLRANVEGGSIPDLFIPLRVDLWQRGESPFDRQLGRSYAHADVAEAIEAILSYS